MAAVYKIGLIYAYSNKLLIKGVSRTGRCAFATGINMLPAGKPKGLLTRVKLTRPPVHGVAAISDKSGWILNQAIVLAKQHAAF